MIAALWRMALISLQWSVLLTLCHREGTATTRDRNFLPLTLFQDNHVTKSIHVTLALIVPLTFNREMVAAACWLHRQGPSTPTLIQVALDLLPPSEADRAAMMNDREEQRPRCSCILSATSTHWRFGYGQQSLLGLP